MTQISKDQMPANIPFRHDVRESWLEQLFEKLNATEIRFVHWAFNSSSKPHIRNSLVFINHLGNGWLYLFIAILLLYTQGHSAWPLLITACVAVFLVHCIYPLIKNRLCRLRPCDYDPSLDINVKVLDAYSCPSGHIMTATAVGIPILFMLPQLLPIIIIGYLLIAWARISLGHHYPTDLLAGALLGILISMPVSMIMM